MVLNHFGNINCSKLKFCNIFNVSEIGFTLGDIGHSKECQKFSIMVIYISTKPTTLNGSESCKFTYILIIRCSYGYSSYAVVVLSVNI